MTPWYERQRKIMGEPWRPRLHIERNENGFVFVYDTLDITVEVPVDRAVDVWCVLVRNPPYYVRSRDTESSKLFSYLQYCYFNGVVPDGTDYDAIVERCRY